MVVTNGWSGLCWDYYMSDWEGNDIIAYLNHLFVCSIFSQKYTNRQWTHQPTWRPFKLEPSAPYTETQLKSAERSGGGEREKQCDVITPRFELWKASFCAGYRVWPKKTTAQKLAKRQRIRTIPHEKSINKARIQRLLRQDDGLKKFHRRELPAEPARHKDLDDHILGEEFRKAERHLKSHIPMKS
jgi:hypothetical protein